MDNINFTSMTFNLHDFNRNGTPELIINGIYDDEVYDAVYFFRDGSARLLEFGNGVYIANFARGARAGIRGTPGSQPGLIAYVIGPIGMNMPTRILFWRFVIDGDMLVNDTRGTAYLHENEENDRFYIDDEAVAKEEFDLIFDVPERFDERLKMRSLYTENIEALFTYR